MSQIEDRLAELGIELPQPNAPVANYAPFVRLGEMIHISGQVSLDASGGIKGVVGEDLDLATAQRAARLCGLSLIAQMKAACDGHLGRADQPGDRSLPGDGRSHRADGDADGPGDHLQQGAVPAGDGDRPDLALGFNDLFLFP